jgi:UDP-N-acetylmuramoyl-tripeptide--D-alanyl-D-alanine ligase
MMMSQVAEALVAENLNAEFHGRDVMMTGVSKDTRDIHVGDLYVALIGEHFDGHRFIGDANAAGAVGALVSEYQVGTDKVDVNKVDTNKSPMPPSMPVVQVEDTRLALGKLAAHWRQSWAQQSENGKLIGITGSNGKTSVKEMSQKILADFTRLGHADLERAGSGHAGSEAVFATKGNLNNDIGMPMMLLELRQQHQFAVIEMGANHVGEIDYLTSIAKPDIAIVNNVGPAHLEGFGSLENIAKAKAEIYNGLSANGIAVINKDDAFSAFWFDYCAKHCAAEKIISFSMLDDKAEIYAAAVFDDVYLVTLSEGESIEQAELKLNVPGKHNVMNALAAIAVTTSAGVPLASAVASLSNFENIAGRLTMLESAMGYRVIDDTYNANPLSVSAAIDVLVGLQSGAEVKTVLVLGDMGELGTNAQALHDQIGEKAKAAGVDAFYATGKYCQGAVSAFGENGFWFQDKTNLTNTLNNDLTGNEVVLVKGSRSAAMEEVVDQILTHEKNNKRVN